MTEPPVHPPELQDRSTLLYAFGLVEIVLGVFCLMLTAMTGLALLGGGPAGAPGAAPDPRLILPGLFLYLLLAVYYLTTGIGSVRLRRWARPIVLIVSWIWLVTGVFSLTVAAVFLPKMMEQVRPPGTDSEVLSVAQGCTFFLLAIFYLVLPGLFVTVYGSPHVRATFERRDPVPRWTDRCPTSVLGVAFLLAYGAFGLLFAALSAASFLQKGFDWKEYYTKMGLAPAQLAELQKMGFFDFFHRPEVLALSAVVGVVSLAFLLWVKKFFRAGAGTPQNPL